MPRRLRKPNLPHGPRKDFVDHLWRLYNRADYPALQMVSATIRDLALTGTASHETVRRVMRQGDIPRHWSTVEAIYVGLCSLTIPKIDPDTLEFDQGGGGFGYNQYEPSETGRELTRRLWREAYEAQDAPDDHAPPAPDPLREPPF